MARTENIQIRVTAQEKAAIAEAAAKSQRTMGRYLVWLHFDRQQRDALVDRLTARVSK